MFVAKHILGGIFLPSVSFAQRSPRRCNMTCIVGCEAESDIRDGPTDAVLAGNGTVGLSFRKPAEPESSKKLETPNMNAQTLCERFPSAHGQISKRCFPLMIMHP